MNPTSSYNDYCDNLIQYVNDPEQEISDYQALELIANMRGMFRAADEVIDDLKKQLHRQILIVHELKDELDKQTGGAI